jgi:hypothetical protein
VSPRAFAPALVALLPIIAASAQTQYEDLNPHRPVAIQDAYAIERYAFDLQVGPAAIGPGDRATYALETALAWGALPRTQIEITAPLASAFSTTGTRTAGLGGLSVGALYGFNVETLALPAFAAVANVTTTAGPLAPAAPLLTIGAIATRSAPGVRVHLNAALTIGPADTSALAGERDRWFAGLGVDHTWPIRSLLAIATITSEQPLAPHAATAWSAGAGARWQWTPQLVLDAGANRRFTGEAPAWSATIGITWTFAVRALMGVEP